MNSSLPAGPSSLDYISAVPVYPMYGNDVKGDCAIAAIGHLVQWWTALTGNPQTPSLNEILRVYSILSPNDDGCILTDVLSYWTKNPICGITIAGHASVNPLDDAEFQAAMAIFGGLYTGVELPILAQSQNVWDYIEQMASDPRASYGSWGGHCIPVGKYRPIEAQTHVFTDHSAMMLGKKAARVNPHALRVRDLLTAPPPPAIAGVAYGCVTWGAEKILTGAWKSQYMSEAHVIISKDWVGKDGKTPEGIDQEALNDYISSVH